MQSGDREDGEEDDDDDELPCVIGESEGDCVWRGSRLSKGVEEQSWLPKSGWKIIPQSRTGSWEAPITKFIMCLQHEQLPRIQGRIIHEAGEA